MPTQNILSELRDLAGRVAKDFNEIQTNGIDLNGRSGKTMFSINSMKYEVENTNISGQENEVREVMIKRNSLGWKLVSTSTFLVDTSNQFSNLYLIWEKK